MSSDTQQLSASQAAIAADLYAVVVFVHKACNQDFFEALAELDLSLTQIKALHYLEGATPDLTLKTLAELIPVSLPAASRVVDDLVRRNFVERWEDEADRRMKRVAITEEGRCVTRRLNAARLAGLEQFTATLSPSEQTALAPALAALLAREEIAACRPEGVTP
jgi:DNA-binding MarR family transcriptional regulator